MGFGRLGAHGYDEADLSVSGATEANGKLL